MNNAFSQIIEHLEKKGVEYFILTHEPVYTMQDVAQELDIPENSKVKTLVLQEKELTSTSLILCGISAKGKLDFGALARVMNIPRSKLSMASPAQVVESLGMPQGAIGLITPKGDPKIFLSSSFSQQNYLHFGIGRNDKTIRIKLSELKTITNISIADIERN